MVFSWISVQALAAELAIHRLYAPVGSVGRGIVLYVCLFAVLGLAKVCYRTLIYPDYVSPYRNLPAPEHRSKLLGAFISYYVEQDFDAGRRHAEAHRDLPFVRFPGVLGADCLVPTSIAAATEILNGQVYDFGKPQTLLRGFRGVFGNGLFLAEGEVHRQQRKLVTPALALPQVRGMIPVITRNCKHATEVLDAGKKAGEVVVLETIHFMARLTLDIIGEASFGSSMRAVDDEHGAVTTAYWAITNPKAMPKIYTLNALIPGFNKLPLAINRQLWRDQATVYSFCKNLAMERKSFYDARRQKASEAGAILEKEPYSSDVVSYFVQDTSHNWTADEIANQMMVFLIGGHESTTTTISWALFQMCESQDMQERARAEIRENFPDGIESIRTQADLDKMPFVQNFIMEILRLRGPVPRTVREAYKDTYVQGVKIRKGTDIDILPPLFNRDRSLWGDDADSFNPDRWATRRPAEAYAFMTFLNGVRICIGRRMAEFELRLLLAAFVGRYKLEFEQPGLTIDAMETGCVFTFRPVDEVHVKMTIIDDWN
ncbi:cytochrome P450 [Dipodascopsis tothii]|uniref:cytochrome P450 n=1 Tax=Dipodascopsis tothii TaxID=44089 RepID=UPI0034CFF415